jgi:excisionase family DNA binding protein
MSENGATAAADGLLTVAQAAREAAISPWTVRRWIRHGRLPSVRLGRRHHISPDDFAATLTHIYVGMVVPEWRRERRRSGMRLRAVREAAGLTQLELAARSGLTHEAISNLEVGRRTPYAETVRKLARALRVEPERFVGHEPIGLTVLTVAETAARLDVPAGRVQTWLREGLLSGTKVSGEWRVPAVAVTELGRSGRLRGQSRRLDPRYRG